MSNFFPTLSKKNTDFIKNLIDKKNFDLIIEFGSGNSTIFFLELLKKKRIKFISIENSKRWFYEIINLIRIRFDILKENIQRKYWPLDKYENFYNNCNYPYTKIESGISRIEKWKRVMKLGPFFRFEKDAYSKNVPSKVAGKFKKFRNIFIIVNKFLRIFPKFAYETTSFSCKIEKLFFIYHLVSPSIKDQFGESPNRDEYCYAGSQYLNNNHKEVLVMIDAGPRHYILDQLILNKSKNSNLHILLFDAHRPEYSDILKKYDGKFINGSKYFYGNLKFLQTKEQQDKELWYYTINSKDNL